MAGALTGPAYPGASSIRRPSRPALAANPNDGLRRKYREAYDQAEMQAGMVEAHQRRVAEAQTELAAAEAALTLATDAAWEAERQRQKEGLLAKAAAVDRALAEAGGLLGELAEQGRAYDAHVRLKRWPWWGSGMNQAELDRVTMPVLTRHFAGPLRAERSRAAKAPTLAAEISRLSEAYEERPEPEPAPAPPTPVVDTSRPDEPPSDGWLDHMAQRDQAARAAAARANVHGGGGDSGCEGGAPERPPRVRRRRAAASPARRSSGPSARVELRASPGRRTR